MTQVSDELTLRIDQEIEINAPAEKVFDAVVANLTDAFGPQQGLDMKMKLEPWPGGRWFRDLGDNQGHFWGHVQVIKRPTLLEICGPMFMSYPVSSHLQLRLTQKGSKTLLVLRHQALGLIQDDHRKGVNEGWGSFTKGVKEYAERNK